MVVCILNVAIAGLRSYGMGATTFIYLTGYVPGDIVTMQKNVEYIYGNKMYLWRNAFEFQC